MASDATTGILVNALHTSSVVDFIYDGKYRIVEVHAVGRSTKDGSVVMRGYQIAGEASRPLPQWTLFTVSKIEMPQQMSQRSQAPREGYTMGDKQMQQPVIAELVL